MRREASSTADKRLYVNSLAKHYLLKQFVQKRRNLEQR